MLEHGWTCYHGIVLHHGNTIVVETTILNPEKIVVLSQTKSCIGKTLVPFQVNVISLCIIFKV